MQGFWAGKEAIWHHHYPYQGEASSPASAQLQQLTIPMHGCYQYCELLLYDVCAG